MRALRELQTPVRVFQPVGDSSSNREGLGSLATFESGQQVVQLGRGSNKVRQIGVAEGAFSFDPKAEYLIVSCHLQRLLVQRRCLGRRPTVDSSPGGDEYILHATRPLSSLPPVMGESRREIASVVAKGLFDVARNNGVAFTARSAGKCLISNLAYEGVLEDELVLSQDVRSGDASNEAAQGETFE